MTQATCQQTAAKLAQTAQRPKGQSRRRQSEAATANPGGTQQWQVHKIEQVRLRSDLSADWNALPNSKNDRRHTKERLASHDRRETWWWSCRKLDLLEGGHA